MLLSLCDGNPPDNRGFPAQWDSNTENVSISWRHNDRQQYPAVNSQSFNHQARAMSIYISFAEPCHGFDHVVGVCAVRAVRLRSNGRCPYVVCAQHSEWLFHQYESAHQPTHSAQMETLRFQVRDLLVILDS